MAKFKSSKIAGKQPPLGPFAPGLVTCVFAQVAVSAALAANDILEGVEIPAGCVPINVEVYSTDIDTGTAAIVTDIGILNADRDAVATVLINDSQLGRSAGEDLMDAAQQAVIAALAPSATAPACIGAKVVTVANAPAAGTVTFKVEYVAL